MSVQPITLPKKPVPLETVIETIPAVRQSVAASFDDCPLSAKFDALHGQGWSTHPQARGQIFHRFAAECLRTLRRQGHRSMPVTVALDILREVLQQRGVAPEDIVRVPLRERRALRNAAVKFAKDNQFDVHNIIDVEKRLAAPITYVTDEGEQIERTLTGQLDVLMTDPPAGAIVIDWKDTWALPPERSQRPAMDSAAADDPEHISYEGYFQQRFYAWLVMVTYPAVQYVTLREFYVRRSVTREATLHRTRLYVVEEELSDLMREFDAAAAAGLNGPLWIPSPGKHCNWCLRPGQCPIEREARGEGAIQTEEDARRYAAELVVANRVRKHRREALAARANARGPVPVKDSKGRRELGHRAVKRTERPTKEEAQRAIERGVNPVDLYKTKTGTRFEEYTPDRSDRGAHPADGALDDAIRESTRRAQEARRRRVRGRRRNGS